MHCRGMVFVILKYRKIVSYQYREIAKTDKLKRRNTHLLTKNTHTSKSLELLFRCIRYCT